MVVNIQHLNKIVSVDLPPTTPENDTTLIVYSSLGMIFRIDVENKILLEKIFSR